MKINIKGTEEPCIYFLYQGNKIVYIGQSTQLMYRIGTHRQYHKKIFDAFEVAYIEYDFEKRLKLEKKLIKIHKPKYNKGHLIPIYARPLKKYIIYDLKNNIDFIGNRNEIKELVGQELDVTNKMCKGRYILKSNLKQKHINQWKEVLNIKTGEIDRYNKIRLADKLNISSNNLSSFFLGRHKILYKTYIII